MPASCPLTVQLHSTFSLFWFTLAKQHNKQLTLKVEFEVEECHTFESIKLQFFHIWARFWFTKKTLTSVSHLNNQAGRKDCNRHFFYILAFRPLKKKFILLQLNYKDGFGTCRCSRKVLKSFSHVEENVALDKLFFQSLEREENHEWKFRFFWYISALTKFFVAWQSVEELIFCV